MTRFGGRGRIALAGLLVALVAVVALASLGGGPPVPGALGGPTGASDDAAPTGPQFRNVTASSGLDYVARAAPTMIVNGGVYVVDYDDDGWRDLLAVGGPEPVLYRNAGGTFERSGALPTVNGTVEAAHAFDVEGDGDEDLLLLAQRRRPVLLENRDDGFERSTLPVTLTYPVGAASADYDGDGCLDLFVVQYADWAEKRPAGVGNETVPPAEDNGNPNVLLRGSCGEGFERVDAGIDGTRWSLAASFADLTGDGRPDVHVANDFAHDVLYVNRGDGRFEKRRLGDETNRNAMSSEVGDVDGDGRYDVFVTNIHLPALLRGNTGAFAGRMDGNNLLLNREEGFVDRAGAYGVRRGGWGWAAVLADFDNDGDQDLFHTTKRMAMTGTVQSRIVKRGGSVAEYREDHPAIVYPQYYLRTDDSFVVQRAASLGFEGTSGTGAARLDYDRDGDPDLAVAQVDGRFHLYENTAEGGHWLRIHLRASEGHPATGARVNVTVDGRTHHRLANGRADLLSQDSRVIHVGVGDAERVDRVRVVWPDGSTTLLEDVATDQRLVLSADESG